MSSHPPWPVPSIAERAVRDADYDALWALHVDTMREYVAATYGWVDAAQAEMFRERWAANLAQRVLVDGGSVVAAFLVQRRADDVYLASVEVAPSHQGRGLGTAIVRRVLAAADTAFAPARLQVMKANPRARRLYERLGFAIEGETPTHCLMVSSPGRMIVTSPGA
jgi:ribosomal protein S18 acetylase RimI-like enzyme